MGIKVFNLKYTVAAFAAIIVFSGAARAQDGAEDLLGQLKTAPPSESTRIERDLEIIWARSGSAAMDLLLSRGRAAMANDDVSAAIEHFTALTDHAPQFAEGWHARASAYHAAGLYGPALNDLERALSLNPDNFNAIFGLGVMFQEFGDTGRAIQAFRQVLALHPNHENAKTALARVEREETGQTL